MTNNHCLPTSPERAWKPMPVGNIINKIFHSPIAKWKPQLSNLHNAVHACTPCWYYSISFYKYHPCNVNSPVIKHPHRIKCTSNILGKAQQVVTNYVLLYGIHWSCFKYTDVQDSFWNLRCQAFTNVEYKPTTKFPVQYHPALSLAPCFDTTQMRPLNHVLHIVLGRHSFMSFSLHIHTNRFNSNLTSIVCNCQCVDHHLSFRTIVSCLV